MIEVVDNTYFHLLNEKISYVFYIMKNKQLGHLYYGKTLGNLKKEDFLFLMDRENKSAGTVKYYSDDSLFTLSDRLQEYPVYGTTDFKEGAIEIFKGETPLYLDFKFEKFEITRGKKRNLKIPAAFGDKENVETLTIFLEDDDHKIKLEQRFSIFSNSTAIVKNQKIINIGEQEILLQKMASGVFECNNRDYQFVHLSGAWLKERQIKRKNLSQGSVSIGSLKGASGHQHNPFVALQESNGSWDTGVVYGVNLIYSGNFLSQVETDEWNNTRLMIGIHPNQFSWELATQETFETPESVFVYSDQGMNGMSQEFSAFIEKHIISPIWYKKERPIIFNSWEAVYFDFNEESLLELAKKGKKLGMECFVLDDGWFGKRDSDRNSLGDWHANLKKFPNGLGNFSKNIKALGLKMGLWFEPEMISPDSNLFKDHPEWVIHHPFERKSIGRGQYVLDFSNPEVIENIYEQMKTVIEESQIDYIKWDMNRNITEAYSTHLEKEGIHQTEFFHRYILGVYNLYYHILTDFPNILIEGCAGGGGRYDLGVLFYSPQIWPSDDSDAVERLSILSGTLLAYPLSTFSNHISASPNHQVYRQTSIEMRQHVGIFGPMGYELDLNQLSEHEEKVIQASLDFYKKHRSLLTYGNFIQLVNPELSENEKAWAVLSNDGKEAIVGFYRVLAKPNGTALEYLKLPFIDEEKNYQINNDSKISGSILKHIGLRKPYQFNGANYGQAELIGDFQSCIYSIRELK